MTNETINQIDRDAREWVEKSYFPGGSAYTPAKAGFNAGAIHQHPISYEQGKRDAQRWTPVSIPPEAHKTVLCYGRYIGTAGNGELFSASIYNGGKWYDLAGQRVDVTHWMEAPPKPE